MDLKVIKEKLKSTLSLLLSENSSEELKVSDLSVGGKVEMVNADGTLSDAPDGEYTVGEDVIVVKDGLIVSINGNTEKPAEENPVEEMEEEVPQSEDAPNEMDSVKADLAELKSQMETYMASVDELKQAVEDMKQQMSANATAEQEMSEQFSTQIETLNESIKTLITTPAEFSRTNNSNLIKDSKEEKMKEYAKVLGGMKKN